MKLIARVGQHGDCALSIEAGKGGAGEGEVGGAGEVFM